KYKKDLVLKIDKSKANMNGLTVAEIEQQIAYTVNGLSEALFNDNENILDVKVSTDIKSRTDLLDLNIKTSMGTVVPLREIATLRVANNLEYSKTFNGRPSITIDAYMEDGYSTYALEKDIKEIIDAHIDNSIDVVYKGDNELTNEVFSGLIIAFAIALFVIYMIMYVQFKSLKQPLIILVAIPLSFIGSLAMMLALGEKITLTSLLGVMSLVGIVVNNGILLVEYINRHHENGHSIYDSCIKAVERRLRPIALSSLTTIFGLIPLALYGGDFFRPMAVTFIGGMLTSALLVLLIIPSLYYFTYKKQDLRKMQPPIQ
ncbi:MAG: efflux RND transporter permease subunit, partial [Clostridiales bacterium]|nr:efflux RND transporter permease subunit [Clostridiales bacterium]